MSDGDNWRIDDEMEGLCLFDGDNWRMNDDVTEGLIGSRVDNCIGVVCDNRKMHDVCDE